MQMGKSKFYHSKNRISLDVDVCYDFFSWKNCKYFIGYKDDNHKIKQLLPKTSAFVKKYDHETKWMYFLLKMINYSII